MAVDTPARIAIIGAGPIGLEAALYARFLGYDVDLYERDVPLSTWHPAAGDTWLTPWRELVTPLGLAALQSQDSAWQPAVDDALLTVDALIRRYWQPLADSDLVVDALRLGTTVEAVTRPHLLKEELVDDPGRGDDGFRLWLRSSDGHMATATADVVLDASGLDEPRGAGEGGGPVNPTAPCSHGWIDLRGNAATEWAGRRVLVIGAGLTAATNVVALAGLEPRVELTWITRREPLASSPGPIELRGNRVAPQRAARIAAANALAAEPPSHVRHWSGTSLVGWEPLDSGGVRVTLAGEHAGSIEVDRVIANVGRRPCHRLARTLALDLDPAWEVSRGMGAWLRGMRGASHGLADHFPPAAWETGEPHYYLLGSKSWGLDPRFELATGHAQIRDLFKIIGDREGLDLYRTIRR